MILFFLPVLFVVILGPTGIKVADDAVSLVARQSDSQAIHSTLSSSGLTRTSQYAAAVSIDALTSLEYGSSLSRRTTILMVQKCSARPVERRSGIDRGRRRGLSLRASICFR